MAGLASGNPYCEACGSEGWSTSTNCTERKAEVCSECGVCDGDHLLCKTCAASCQAEARLDEKIYSTNTFWDEYQENWVEMVEFRVPPKRAERMQMALDFSVEVA
jgi:hypothetical protein